MPKFDRSNIVAAHTIAKRDADILYVGLRKIHYNIMRFDNTMTADEADALAGRAKTTSAQHYVLHDLKSFTDKYIKSWSNFEIDGRWHGTTKLIPRRYSIFHNLI